MIYVVIGMFVFLVEMICWGLRESHLEHHRWGSWMVAHAPQDPILKLLRHIERPFRRANTGIFTTAGRKLAEKMLKWWEHSRWTDHVDVFLRTIEVGNSIW